MRNTQKNGFIQKPVGYIITPYHRQEKTLKQKTTVEIFHASSLKYCLLRVIKGKLKLLNIPTKVIAAKWCS